MDPLSLILLVLVLGLLVSIVLRILGLVPGVRQVIEAFQARWRSRGTRSDDTGPGD